LEIQDLIHSTAIVHPRATIGEGSRIGPFCIVEENVVLGKECFLESHVVLRGHTRLGDKVRVYPQAVIGAEPQHVGYNGEPTRVEIGNGVVIREGVTIHRGTPFGTGETRIEDHSYIMAYAHVAHDCRVGKNVIIANSVQMAGHVEIEDFAVIGGLSAIAQHCRIGRYCYLGGCSGIRKDLPPFLLGKGYQFRVQGINVVGLTRQGFSSATLARLKRLYKIFYLQKLTVNQAIEKALLEIGETDDVKLFIDFIKGSKLGFTR